MENCNLTVYEEENKEEGKEEGKPKVSFHGLKAMCQELAEGMSDEDKKRLIDDPRAEVLEEIMNKGNV